MANSRDQKEKSHTIGELTTNVGYVVLGLGMLAVGLEALDLDFSM